MTWLKGQGHKICCFWFFQSLNGESSSFIILEGFCSLVTRKLNNKFGYFNTSMTSDVQCAPYGGFIKGILRGVRCTKSLRVLFLHRRPPSWTTLVLYSRAVFIFNEPAFSYCIDSPVSKLVARLIDGIV
jgi:hypothetical protein